MILLPKECENYQTQTINQQIHKNIWKIPRRYAKMSIKVTNDLLFKKMLASEENKDITQGFIKDFCGLDAACEDIHIMNPYSIDLSPCHSARSRRIH